MIEGASAIGRVQQRRRRDGASCWTERTGDGRRRCSQSLHTLLFFNYEDNDDNDGGGEVNVRSSQGRKKRQTLVVADPVWSGPDLFSQFSRTLDNASNAIKTP